MKLSKMLQFYGSYIIHIKYTHINLAVNAINLGFSRELESQLLNNQIL
jgi:hypothetical protein